MNPAVAPPPPQFTRRLTILLVAFIAAQVMYCIVASVIRESGFQPPFHDASERAALLPAIYVIGLLAIAGSFVLTNLPAFRSQSPEALQRQFFIGFAVADTGAVLGLLLFFFYGDLKPLVILAVLAAGAIFAHYLQVCRKLPTR